MRKIRVIDSHTGGEPTRIIVRGGPELQGETPQARRDHFRDHFDAIRRAVINEPRGSDVLVGGLLCKPIDPTCVAGVIFFNNVGFLGMCIHGTIGLVVTLDHLGRLDAGQHRIETPVGIVQTSLKADGQVAVTNVPSYRYLADVTLDVPTVGQIVGDVAWGGNWFFLVKEGVSHPLHKSHTDQLTRITLKIRQALESRGITGANGAVIDHIELFGPPDSTENDSKNFVLCPGGAYDRSPCGTGTSAKLACLAADGQLAPGEVWNQESIIGSRFSGTYQTLPPDSNDDKNFTPIIPTVTGSAFVNGEATLLLNPHDPFCMGIPE